MLTLLTGLLYVAVAAIAIFVIGSLATFFVERSPYQKTFVAERAPDPLPDGFHPGEAHVLLDIFYQHRLFRVAKTDGERDGVRRGASCQLSYQLGGAPTGYCSTSSTEPVTSALSSLAK